MHSKAQQALPPPPVVRVRRYVSYRSMRTWESAQADWGPEVPRGYQPTQPTAKAMPVSSQHRHSHTNPAASQLQSAEPAASNRSHSSFGSPGGPPTPLTGYFGVPCVRTVLCTPYRLYRSFADAPRWPGNPGIAHIGEGPGAETCERHLTSQNVSPAEADRPAGSSGLPRLELSRSISQFGWGPTF